MKCRIESAIVGESTFRSAHNLDDLRERWLERKNGKLPPISGVRPGSGDIDFIFTTELRTEVQARAQDKYLTEQMETVQDLLGGMRRRSADRWIREDLIQRQKEIAALKKVTKAFLHDWSTIATSRVLRRLVTDHDPELEQMSLEILDFRVRNIRMSELPKDEHDKIVAVICAVQDILMERKLSGSQKTHG